MRINAWCLQVQDSFPFSIGFSSDEGPISTLSSNILFRKGQPFPSVKMLTFQRTHTFHLEAFYANESELPPGTSPKISSFTVCLLLHMICFGCTRQSRLVNGGLCICYRCFLHFMNRGYHLLCDHQYFLHYL